MKAADPACRLVGVCTTQDFGVDNADSFARGCLEKGIAPYLDALSFHPYAAAMDNGRLSAAPFIRMFADLFRLADGRPAAALWAFEDIRRFVVETSAEVIDMYGNRLSGDGDRPRPDCGDRPRIDCGDRPRAEGACPQGTTEWLIDERPLYVIGTGDADAFFGTLRIRPEKPALVNGARRIDAETVSVELLNLTDGDLSVRTTVADDTHDVVLTTRERRAERFRVMGTDPGAGVGTGPARLESGVAYRRMLSERSGCPC